MTSDLLKCATAHISDRGVQLDDHQRRVLKRLAQWLQRRLQPSRWRRKPAAGVYLWGSVGRGKSLLLDALFQQSPCQQKRRVHVHALLQDIQQRMLGYMGQPDPLLRVADDLASETELLFVDEFHVHDIGDAIMLGRLLGPLIERGCILLLSSNYAPAHLCPNPLYHSRFKPFAELIERQLLVLRIDDGQDYRAISRQHWGRFIGGAFEHLPKLLGPLPPAHTMALGRREIQVLQATPERLVVAFADLCQRPLAASDYLALCQRFAQIVLVDLPLLSRCTPDEQQRLVNFIDIAYDGGCELWLHSEHDLELLCDAVKHTDFSRTQSRLRQLHRH